MGYFSVYLMRPVIHDNKLDHVFIKKKITIENREIIMESKETTNAQIPYVILSSYHPSPF